MRFGLGALGVILFLMTPGGSAAAEPSVAEPPVAFVKSEPLVISCSELAGAGVRVPIRNETAIKQQVRFSFELTRENGRPARPRAVCGGLRQVPKRRTLAPAKSASVTLTAPNAARKGTFSGTLAIFGRRGRVARTDLTISSEPAPEAALAATPIVSTLTEDIHDRDKGPFWIPIEGSVSDLPPPVKDESGVKPIFVGALTGPGDPVAVVYREESEALKPGAAQVGLELEGDLSPGTYSGQADLAPDDPEKGEVSLEFKVSAEVWIAILALLAGIVLGVLLLRISGRTVPRARLLGRAGALAERYEKARIELLTTEGSGTWNRLEVKDLRKRKADLETEIREATRWWKVLVKIDPTVIQKFEKEIETLETEIDLLRKVPEHAQALEGALLQPGAGQLPPLPDSGGAAGKPTVEQEAEKLLKKDGISLAALKPRLDAMDVKAKQIGRLRGLERQLAGHWRRLGALKQPDRPHPDDQKLAKVEGVLEECRKRLWEAADDEALTKAGDQIEAAAGELVQLESEGRVLAKAEIVGFTRLDALEGSPLAFAIAAPRPEVAAYGDGAWPGPAATPGVVAAPAPSPASEPPLLTEGGAKKAVRRALVLQFLAVLAAAAVALATGLELLYVGKTWGTFWDFLAALVWGVTLQAVVTTLVTSLDSLGSLAALWRRP